MNDNDIKLRESAIEYYNRCQLLNVKCVFNNCEIEYNAIIDKLRLIKVLKCSEIIYFDNIYDDIGTSCLFNHLEKVKEIHFGDRVTFVDYNAFAYCSELIKVTFATSSDLIIEDEAFSHCLNLKEVIASNIIHIGEESFYACINLQKIDLSHVKMVGYYAFYDCRSLLNISLDNVELLSIGCFSSCSNLNNVYIGKYLKILKREAFFNCNLKYVKIDALCTYFDFKAFSNSSFTLDLLYKDEILKRAIGNYESIDIP